MFVYQATNLINGKRYLGITEKPLCVRTAGHAVKARGGSRTAFHAAIRKYGIEFFRFTVLLRVKDRDSLLAQERRLIALLAPEYNLTKGGEGVFGLQFSRESREKMRTAAIRRGPTWACGAMPDSIRRKLREAAVNREKSRSREFIARRKISVAKATAAVRRKITRLDTGERFSSIMDAALATGLSHSTICNALRRKTAGRHGIRFVYAGAA